MTLKPLEKKILKDFGLSKFVLCTDTGLSSIANRLFNDRGDRAFITTQSVKKLKGYLKDWVFDPEGWRLPGTNKIYSLNDIDEADPDQVNKVYYKSRWVNDDGLEQKLIVSFSLKYKNYLRSLRASQILRAEKKLTKPSTIKSKRPNDPNRFIKDIAMTEEGEIAEDMLYVLNEEAIAKEAIYDGFYAVCTNLEAQAHEIIAVNKQRWQVEEAFRTLKSEFRARPVYLQRDDRILAHFITCFLALLIFKILKEKIQVHLPKQNLTISSILHEIREMNFFLLEHEGYIPTYTRTEMTDALHEVFGFRTDYQILSNKDMNDVIKFTKK